MLTLATWNLLLGTFAAGNRAAFVTILSHTADTHRSQKSHTIDGLLRQSWGIFLPGAEDSVSEGHSDLLPQLPFKR
jgi:hypothetical protein